MNHGNGVTVYEAVYGATHEAVPPDTANPLPLILPAIELLKDMQELNTAARIQKAVEDVLVEGKIRTRDIGGTASTTQFTEAIVSKLNVER
jgi:isocitrate dehydrogenase (NAD+)